MLCGCFICLVHSIIESMCVTGVVSLKPRCYEADVMVHVVKNHLVYDR